MILIAVDDLLFSSKIRAVAKQLGVELVFGRSPEEVLERVRTHRPSLAIFDLNSDKIQPLESISTIKNTPELKSTRTIGFVSHVHTQLIQAAQTSGIDEVMARSAFAARLPEILQSGQ
jgi:DNA-binding NarL/FixJ family response regulator